MCPSYRATGEKEHSTRGRARLLFEMMRGHEDSPISDGWRSEAVKDSLDLCLSCKECKSDCPTGVGMATYKAEFLAQHYRGRVRPVAHYSLGWMPAFALGGWVRPRLGQRGVACSRHCPAWKTPGRDHAGTSGPPVRALSVPASVAQPRGHRAASWRPGRCRAVAGYVHESFRTAHREGNSARSGGRGLSGGCAEPAGCGLTWISTGQLTTARLVLGRTLRILRPWLEAGTPIVGMEPSCSAVFRSDMRDLLPHDDDANRMRDQVVTLAEALTQHAHGWRPPDVGHRAVVQTH